MGLLNILGEESIQGQLNRCINDYLSLPFSEAEPVDPILIAQLEFKYVLQWPVDSW
jgi:hypothetical protein